MNFMKKNAFVLSYLGGILLIVATFVPIVKFNNQSFSFIDQFLSLSIIIAIMSTIILILVTLKKYKLSLIPLVINIGVIGYGVYNIFSIDGLKLAPNLSYGIALILYPLGALFAIIGGLLTESKIKEATNSNVPKDNIYEEVTEEVKNEFDTVNNDIIIDEQIPLEKIIKKDISNNSVNELNDIEPNSITDNNIKDEAISDDLIDIDSNNEDILIEENNIDTVLTQSDNASLDLNNQINDNDIFNSLPDNIDDINQDTENSSVISSQSDINANVITENNNNLIDEENELNNVNISPLEIDPDQVEDITLNNLTDNINTNDIHEEEIIMNDIVEDEKKNTNIFLNYPKENGEIPDIVEDDLMVNNIQPEDKKSEQFMAINPSDIKIDEKKSLFKKKEKQEEDPLEKIMKRNIPTSLGRKCQFCESPLGDDERICPLCGRIN